MLGLPKTNGLACPPLRARQAALTTEGRPHKLHLVARGLKASSICPIMSALRFFYGTTLGNRAAAAEIPLPRKADPLPAILSQDEVKRLLRSVVLPPVDRQGRGHPR